MNDDHALIPLTGLVLPTDFPWRVGCVARIDGQLRLRGAGPFVPLRFFGYYFRGDRPIAICGRWTVPLDPLAPITLLPELIAKFTPGRSAIVSASRAHWPECILVHDTRDGGCWLWNFAAGQKFIKALEPVLNFDHDRDDAEEAKLRGPGA